MTDSLHVRTTVHAPPDAVYDVLRDVEGFEAYSDRIEGVTRHGSGGAGTAYDVTLSWWRLSYTARFRVTDLDPPERIEWRLARDLDARGTWRLEPVDVDEPGVDRATRVDLTARYDPDTAEPGGLSLPPLVPLSRVLERARPAAEREAERVLARVVADLEGEPRRASLTVETRSDAR